MVNNDDNAQEKELNELYDDNGQLVEYSEQSDLTNDYVEEVVVSDSNIDKRVEEDSSSSTTREDFLGSEESSSREEALDDEDIRFLESLRERNSIEDIDSVSSIDKEDLVKSKNDYFEDDEFFLGDDEEILSELDMAAFQQLDGVVTWEIENLHDSEGQTLSKRDIRMNPPLLKIKSSSGEYAEFILTKDFSKTLAEKFDEIYRAYYGVKPKGKGASISSVEDFKKYVLDHKVGTIVVVILVLIFFVYGVVIG